MLSCNGMKTLNRYQVEVAMPQERVEYRYVELRYEGDNVITGTLLRYDDTAVFPMGAKNDSFLVASETWPTPMLSCMSSTNVANQ